MKKSLILTALAGVALVGCTSDDYLGGNELTSGNGEISFGTKAQQTTRDANFTGKTAAEKLNNNFIVYGFKYTTSEDLTTSANDKKVFDLYNVNYTDGTANTTESNTSGWEYVGYDAHGPITGKQTIKYWDYATTGYVFSAVSGTGITATKTTTGTTVYDKGWKVSIPAGGSLSDLYASNRVEKKKATSGDYGQEVTLTFYSLATKVRFGVYETVPGYSVQINKFYYNNGSSTTNFGVDGNFKNLNTSGATELNVTYYDNTTAIVNRPKVGFGTGVSTAAYGEFGTNIQPTAKIGETSKTATYDQTDGEYTAILPYESGATANDLTLKVDYTLTSTDGSGETIKVTGATAKVPTIYTQWKPNFAYTYIFKISDNTNGSTGTPGTDPAGLYPITFDAEVSTVTDGIQETITSVADPSITTYQKGVVVTANNEYVAGDDIYYTNDTKDVSAYEVYEVNNTGSIEKFITEEVVANWQNNFVTLTKVTSTAATTIPLSDGTSITAATNQAKKFTPAAGKTYVIASGDITAAGTKYKVVRVAGDETAETYTSAMTAATISATNGKAVYKLTSNSPAADALVLGAKPSIKIYDAASKDVTGNFTITDKFDGTYEIALTTAAIAAGAKGTYTVKFASADDQTFEVTITYALDPTSMTIVAGNATGANTVLKIGGTATDGDVVNTNSDIKVERTAAGTYKVTATAAATSGNKTLTIGGETLTVTVDSYSFTDPITIIRKLTGDATGTITLKKNGAALTANNGDLTTTPALATGTTVSEDKGVYTYTAASTTTGGTYTITKENASATVTVKAYTLKATTATIAHATGSTVVTVKENDKTINASKAAVTVYKGSVDAANKQTSGFSLTTNGQTMTFGNVAAAGTYILQYTVKDGANDVVVAQETITVN